MADKSELSVGQEVWIRPIGNEARRNAELRKGRITKIGRKYFYVALDGRRAEDARKIFIDTMVDDNGEYSSNWKVYLDKQQILDEQEVEQLEREIRQTICHYGHTQLTLDQLRRIASILKEGGGDSE